MIVAQRGEQFLDALNDGDPMGWGVIYDVYEPDRHPRPRFFQTLLALGYWEPATEEDFARRQEQEGVQVTRMTPEQVTALGPSRYRQRDPKMPPDDSSGFSGPVPPTGSILS